MHTIENIRLIADQEIYIRGLSVNVHDINTIIVNSNGVITNAYIKGETWEGWLLPID